MASRNRNTSGDWQVHCKKVRKRTVHLLSSQEWADCTFEFESESREGNSSTATLSAHKLILAMASPVFAAQFYGSHTPENPIRVTDIDRETFRIMLRYIYTDEIDIRNIDTAMDVYYAAKKYILPYLEDDCIQYLLNELGPSNVCRIYEFGSFHDEITLKTKCIEIFNKHTRDVLKSSGFLKAKMETVKEIVSSNKLSIDSELELIKAMLNYADSVYMDASIVTSMADSLSTLFAKHTTKVTKQSKEVGKNNSRSSSESDSDTSANSVKDSDSESTTDSGKDFIKETVDLTGSGEEAEKKPRLNSVVVAKNAAVVEPSTSTANTEPVDRGEMIRKMLRPCVQQIRFLTLSPRQFAECRDLKLLLSTDEMMAIAMNIASHNTEVAMPEGFTECLVPRNVDPNNPAASIRFTINNLARIKKFTSDVFCTRNIPWNVTVILQAKRRTEPQLYVRIELNCLLEREDNWMVPATYWVKTIPATVAVQPGGLPSSSSPSSPQSSYLNKKYTHSFTKLSASVAITERVGIMPSVAPNTPPLFDPNRPPSYTTRTPSAHTHNNSARPVMVNIPSQSPVANHPRPQNSVANHPRPITLGNVHNSITLEVNVNSDAVLYI